MGGTMDDLFEWEVVDRSVKPAEAKTLLYKNDYACKRRKQKNFSQEMPSRGLSFQSSN